MPTVPTATQTEVTQVSQRRLNVSASQEDFGAAESRALNQLGNVAANRAKEIKTQDDSNAVKEAFATASDRMRGFLHGEGGIYSQQGRNAFGSVQSTDEEMAKIQSEVDATLKNDEQKALFNKLWGQRRETSLNGVSRYEAGQRRTYTEQAQAAIDKDALDNAVNNYLDESSIQDSLDIIEFNVRTSGQGKEAGVIDEEIAVKQAQVHKAVIDRMLVNEPELAEKYYEKVKDNIDGESKTVIEKSIQTRTKSAEAQRHTDEIMATVDSASDQLKAARDIDDPDIRDNVVSRVKLRQQEEETIRNREDKKTSENLWVTLEQSMERGAPMDSLEQIRDAAPTRAVRAAMDKVIKDAASGKNVVTDWDKYYELRELSWLSPNQFKSLNLIEFYGDLATPEREKLIDIQQGIGGDGDSAGRSLNNMITTEMASAGLLKESDSPEDANAKKSEVWRGVEADLRQFKDVNGRDATRKEQLEIIDRNLEEIVIPESGLFGTSIGQETVRGFELSSGNFEISIDDVPDTDKAQITEALRDKGLPVTKQKIIDTYKVGLQRNARQ